MIQGKPIFDESSSNGTKDHQFDDLSQQQPQSAQPVERPLVIIERVEYYERGSEMILNMHVRNQSKQNILLHSITCFGRERRLGLQVGSGLSREINEVYRGKLFMDTNRRTVEIDYKAEGGSAYRTVHRAEYQREASNAYGVHEVSYEAPIRVVSI